MVTESTKSRPSDYEIAVRAAQELLALIEDYRQEREDNSDADPQSGSFYFCVERCLSDAYSRLSGELAVTKMIDRIHGFGIDI